MCSYKKKTSKNFGFTKFLFKYDSDDYYYIPGLHNTHEGEEGFLTPVFFKETVLLKYQDNPKYRIEYNSDSYGIIHTDEENIVFGLNRSKKVLMWLGDIAKLPTEEQHYLISENISSDHDIGSEFYKGQIGIEFTEPTLKTKMLDSREKFYKCFQQMFGEKLNKFEANTQDLIVELNPPRVPTEKEKKNIIDILYKINIESLNLKLLKNKVKELLENEKLPENFKEYNSLKTLELLFKTSFPEQKDSISKLILPLFVLNDLRNQTLHCKKQDEKIKNDKSITSRLEISEKFTFKEIYEVLLEKIISCYEYLSNLILESKKQENK